MSAVAGGRSAPGQVGDSRASARDDILARVRAGLRDVPDLSPEEDTPIPWEYGRETSMADVTGRFAETVDDYRAEVVRCALADVPAQIVAALQAADVASVVLPSGVPGEWRDAVVGASIEVRSDEPALTNDELDHTGGVVTGAAVGIAETGTIVLDHRADQGRRALTLVPDVHVCVVRTDQVVSDVPEAVARLGESVHEGRPQTWISGPSATSDIELDRVEGVHGPRTLVMLLAEV